MFDLDQAIANWRQDLQAAGIRSNDRLDELESHLRDMLEGQSQSGQSGPEAFRTAASQIGRAELLKSEYAKVRQPWFERMKQFFFTFAGIPNFQLAINMNMNTPSQNLEPRWAAYTRAAAFLAPALLVWTAFCIVVLPKLHQICNAAGVAFWRPVATAVAISEFVGANVVIIGILVLGAILWLEWRSTHWARFRRIVFGVTAFVLNFMVLILLAAFTILAVVAGAHFAVAAGAH